MDYDLLIDLGTGSTRAALVDSGGRILSMRSFSNRYYRDEAYPDAQFFLPGEWQGELMRCCLDLCAEHPEVRIRSVSSAGARQSIVLLDGEGKAFYGLPNIDNRGREFMADIGPKDLIYERSGKWVTEDFCAAKLLGLRMRRPGLYEKIRTVLSLSGFIAKIFTGNCCFEPSQACETQLYDLETGTWSDYLCDIYGIDPAMLPPLVMAGESAGPILPDLVESFEMAPDARFIVGGADTQCALLQTGLQPGDVALVSGTTTPVTALTDHRYLDPQQRVWVDANLRAEGYLLEMNPGVTGLNYQRIKDVLAPDLSYETLERAYAEKRRRLSAPCCSMSAAPCGTADSFSVPPGRTTWTASTCSGQRWRTLPAPPMNSSSGSVRSANISGTTSSAAAADSGPKPSARCSPTSPGWSCGFSPASTRPRSTA